jgi:uncharacterized protein (UPF0333 family)
MIEAAFLVVVVAILVLISVAFGYFLGAHRNPPNE